MNEEIKGVRVHLYIQVYATNYSLRIAPTILIVFSQATKNLNLLFILTLNHFINLQNKKFLYKTNLKTTQNFAFIQKIN